MGSERIRPSDEQPILNNDVRQQKQINVSVLEYVAFAIIGIAIVFFFWRRHFFYTSETIDSEVWGHFGDFVGGVAGTLIAYISVRLLVKTLQAQTISNEQLSESNRQNSIVYEIQQFNEMFRLLFAQYQEAVASFRHGELTGKKAIAEIVKEMQVHGSTIDSASFADRIELVMAIYDSFYVNYHDAAPTYFRIVYRIFQLIDKAQIPDDKRTDVIKIMRCQFSEEEMFLLRYNAMSDYGRKMQQYLNRYNIQKHLPMINLLEFSQYKSKLTDEIKQNRLNNELHLLKKEIRRLFLMNDNAEKVFEKQYSGRYHIKVTVQSDNKKFRIELNKNSCIQVASDPSSIDAAFEALGIDKLHLLLNDFVLELFVYSNYSKYNEYDKLLINKDINVLQQAQLSTFYVELTHTEGYALKCTERQLDNPL